MFSFCTSAHRIFCWAFHSGHTQPVERDVMFRTEPNR